MHAAALFDQAPLKDLTGDQVAAVLAPKAGIREGLGGMGSPSLDFIVLFSSTTALLGVRNLGAYAAANAYLDSLAPALAADGYRAVSINWGTWDQLEDLSPELRDSYVASGLHPMSAELALAAMGTAIAGSSHQIMIADIDWSTLRAAYEARRRRPMLGDLANVRSKVAPQPAARRADLMERMRIVGTDERRDLLEAAVRSEVAAVMALRPEEVDPKTGLFEMGMDSLMSVELKRRLEGVVLHPLPTTLTFNYPSVQALAGYLMTVVAPAPSVEPVAAAAAVAADVDPVLELEDDLDDLSEEALADLLGTGFRNWIGDDDGEAETRPRTLARIDRVDGGVRGLWALIRITGDGFDPAILAVSGRLDDTLFTCLSSPRVSSGATSAAYGGRDVLRTSSPGRR